MDTKKTLHLDPAQHGRLLEVATYAGLAAVLIGQAYYREHPLTPEEAVLVLLGAALGLMAACAAAPLSKLLLARRQRGGARQLEAQPTPEAAAFTPQRYAQAHVSSDTPCRAA